MIRSAWAAIASIGRSPRRSTTVTPAQTSRAAAADPMMRMSLTRPTVLFTSPMLVLAISVPPASRTTPSRSSTPPRALTTVVGEAERRTPVWSRPRGTR